MANVSPAPFVSTAATCRACIRNLEVKGSVPYFKLFEDWFARQEHRLQVSNPTQKPRQLLRIDLNSAIGRLWRSRTFSAGRSAVSHAVYSCAPCSPRVTNQPAERCASVAMLPVGHGSYPPAQNIYM